MHPIQYALYILVLKHNQSIKTILEHSRSNKLVTAETAAFKFEGPESDLIAYQINSILLQYYSVPRLQSLKTHTDQHFFDFILKYNTIDRCGFFKAIFRLFGGFV